MTFIKNSKIKIACVAFIASIISAIISFESYEFIESLEVSRQQHKFQTLAQKYIFLIQNELHINLEVLDFYKAFYQASTFISRSDFHVFSKHILEKYTSLQAVEWAPYVKGAERQKYEEKARQFYKNFSFKEYNKNKEIVPEGIQKLYVPVYYMEPHKGNEKILGFDLYSNKKRRQAIVQAVKNNYLTITEPLALIQGKKDTLAFMAFNPVQEAEDSQKIEGFFIGVYKIKKLVDETLKTLGKIEDTIKIFDISRQGKIQIYGSYKKQEALEHLKPYHGSIAVAGRKWQVEVYPYKREDKHTFATIIVPVLTFFIVFILCLYVYLILRKTHDIKKQVVQQTKSLIIAKNEAEKANEIKGQFLANMSHEIRTPIGGILGMSEILLDSQLTKKQKDNVMDIHKSVHFLLEIINDILDFSKINNGKMLLEEVPCSLKKLVTDSCSVLMNKAKKRNLKLTTHIDEDIPDFIRTDPTRLRQILLNLIGNALKFTEKGSVHVQVNLIKKTQAKAAIEIQIKDTGIGIPNSQLENIFHKFTQVDASTTRKYGGSGLGLAICREIAEKMGGHMHVKSIEGQGTAFIINLTFILEKNEGDILVDAKILDKKHLIKGLKVLLVEDHEINQKIAVAYLNNLGIQNIIIANNGIEAIEQYKNNIYDVIFMDCQMPKMDGYEATKNIRHLEQEKKRHTPIIAVTAKAIKGDKEICLNAGMDDYLTKPYTKENFYAIICKWVKV